MLYKMLKKINSQTKISFTDIQQFLIITEQICEAKSRMPAEV